MIILHKILKITHMHTHSQTDETNKFSKVAEYKISTENQLCFYTLTINNAKT